MTSTADPDAMKPHRQPPRDARPGAETPGWAEAAPPDSFWFDPERNLPKRRRREAPFRDAATLQLPRLPDDPPATPPAAGPPAPPADSLLASAPGGGSPAAPAAGRAPGQVTPGPQVGPVPAPMAAPGWQAGSVPAPERESLAPPPLAQSARPTRARPEGGEAAAVPWHAAIGTNEDTVVTLPALRHPVPPDPLIVTPLQVAAPKPPPRPRVVTPPAGDGIPPVAPPPVQAVTAPSSTGAPPARAAVPPPQAATVPSPAAPSLPRAASGPWPPAAAAPARPGQGGAMFDPPRVATRPPLPRPRRWAKAVAVLAAMLVILSAGVLVAKFQTGRLTDSNKPDVASAAGAGGPTAATRAPQAAATPTPSSVPGQTAEGTGSGSTGVNGLRPELVAAFYQARAAARRAGVQLSISSGYRTPAEQQRLYDAALRKYGSARAAQAWVLPPSRSTHVLGIAIDVTPAAGARWLLRHGARYDLCEAYRNEPWHFEYRPEWVTNGHCRAPLPSPRYYHPASA